jgi:GNAT superfamily N-acetyltransferase
METEVVDLDASDADDLLALYATYGWWDDRNAGDVRRALDDSVAVGLRDADSGRLVASARVVTDFVYYATVYDVVVADGARGEGVGQRLVNAVVSHDALDGLDSVTLACRDGLVPFYESCGFEVYDHEIPRPDGDPEPLTWMVYWLNDPPFE